MRRLSGIYQSCYLVQVYCMISGTLRLDILGKWLFENGFKGNFRKMNFHLREDRSEIC